MIHDIVFVFEIVAVFGTVASIGYYFLCLFSAAQFLGERKAAGEGARPTPPTPPVSILKPLKGTDPGMYESFRSHCLQDYPQYEIIFGVSEADEPVIEFVDRLKAEYPQIPIRLVLCLRNLGTNTKVGNLAQMVSHSVLVHTGFFKEVARISFAVVAALTAIAAVAVWMHFDIVQFLNAYAAVYTCGAIATVGLMIRGPIRLAYEVGGTPAVAPQ